MLNLLGSYYSGISGVRVVSSNPRVRSPGVSYFLNIRDVSIAGLHFLGEYLSQGPRIAVYNRLLGSRCKYSWVRCHVYH